MVSKTLTLTNPAGLHMRPAQLFVNAMGKYPCDVTIRYDGKEIMGKSIMNIMAACIKCGAQVEVVCSGDREEEALAEAVALIESGFGE